MVPQLVTSEVQAEMLAYTATSAALHTELLGDSEMPEQLRNASRQAASEQAMQSGVVLSAAHSTRHLVATQ